MAERSAAVSTPLQQELYSGIVNLQALYGKDTDGDGVIDKYDKTSPTTNDGWRQVLAVRIAVVARSNQPERDEVTTTQPQWDLGNVTVGDLTPSNCYTNSKCVPLKVDQASDWKNYRYKVYDTVIPLRNVLWNS
jgi:type IV pilus assembly protein PilW